MRLHEERFVARPLDEVFAYTANFANIQDWDPGVLSSAKVGDDPVGVGTKYQLQVRFGLSTTPMVYEITAYEVPNRVVLVGTGENLTAIDEIRFASLGAGTQITYTADLRFKSALRFVTPLLSPLLERVGSKALDGLVEALDR